MPRDDKDKKHRSRDRSREHSRDRSRRSSRRQSASPDNKRHRSRERSTHKDRHSSRSSKKSKSKAEHADADADADSMRGDDTVGGYKASDNPFNDAALGKKFVWKKKVEQDKARGLSREERGQAEKERRLEAERELENLRKRRELREVERLQRDQEMARVRREQEQEKLGDWERKEEEFHLRQAKKRAEIRIRNHRPKPIDVLAMSLRLANEPLDDDEAAEVAKVRMDSDDMLPHELVQGLSAEECDELVHDVEMYLSLEKNARNQRILDGTQQPDTTDTTDDTASRDLYEAELRKERDPSEAIFSVEATVAAKTYAWQDKHRPRKPRYFNRVHTGYEWNKYNQTHYDKDNPPPKVVQGYKFNIFYPDLIDKSEAPTYRIETDPLSEDTVILRFIAGPPYEDIAFRIVNREWEYNRRRGFKNVFDRGVLQLYFRFKRHYYRR
ncbi:cactus-binding C-terminus of cactin protein-domain-containing protein [Kickxella alabastrina]|uniref:cactus-binding C-terminus of cactin protein-domain-containing protein n=1 Tax=Kickxella alabastrina TaxID=61397 RepID=UPI00221FB4F1|nr:cactus-binding C-terminus of cactin protein-domain-containing protein [Kickxella alabastrina]KAI7834783.1 cactus-binding C-terminus of cactin protein-domain-containing protein [Kickxella alabastrina]